MSGVFLFPLSLLLVSLCSLFYFSIPPLVEHWKRVQRRRIQQDIARIGKESLTFLNVQKLLGVYIFLPPVLGLGSYLFFNRNIFAGLGGFILGMILPSFYIKLYNVQRRKKFTAQLLDSLMILSTSLKGGLSIVQAFEVLVEEMPPPISEEFSLLLREVSLGISLEEALLHLKRRVPSEDLELVVSAVLVGRETGGDLTKVFSQLVGAMRDRISLKEKVKTLTFPAKLQGAIMSCLPIIFIFVVRNMDKHHFDIMLETDIGRILIGIAIFLQIFGIILFKKFSVVKF